MPPLPSPLLSPLLGSLNAPHFFSTRDAGDLAGNDAADAFIHARWPERTLVRCRQVHGAAALPVHSGGARTAPDADALVTADVRTIVAIQTADCVPILLATLDGAVVAAIHAGWRGVVNGVVTNALALVRSLTDQPIFAAVGPCISKAAFEVGPEVADAFRTRFGADADTLIAAGRADRSHVDLVKAVALQLRAGVKDIDVTAALCTVGDPRFFSYRRDAGTTGRMMAGIGPAL